MKCNPIMRALARIRKWYRKCRVCYKYPGKVGLHFYPKTLRTAAGDHTDLMILPSLILHLHWVGMSPEYEQRYACIRIGWIFWGFEVYFRLRRTRARKPEWEY